MKASEKYQIDSPLGRNQRRKFGSLFLVSNKVSGAKGVMKIVTKTSQSQLAEERLKGEASFHFDIEGLPEILDIIETDQEIMVVRKYIPGETIDRVLKRTKKRTQHVFLCNMLKQLGVLLNEIHHRGIYHCDLKPGNILIDKENNVHLIDFGLALRKDEDSERKLLFPLGYAAPELLLNHLDLVDHRTDYFALGITLWRLYAGKIPLTHPNPSIFTNLQLTHPLPESHEISSKMQKVLNKMCAKHSFQMPPNKMLDEEVKSLLSEAKEMRYGAFEEFFHDFVEAGNNGLFTRRYLDGIQG
ncbi:MAG: hypothetical protein Crog4KO_32990 [Crocinitomicaceae bacterium]